MSVGAASERAATGPAPATKVASRGGGFALGSAAVLAVSAVGYWAVIGGGGAPAALPPVPAPPAVTVSPPLQRRLARSAEFTGQFSAVDRVDLRAQVSGYLTEVHFADGQVVHRGDLLYVVDPRPYAIALAQAQAQLAAAVAALDLADKQANRATVLHRSDFESGEIVDQRNQVQQGARAALEGAKATVRAAQLSLDSTRIVAPFTGRIGARLVSVGSLVSGGPGGTDLGSLVSLDPIQLDFDMSEADALTYGRFHAAAGFDVDRSVSIGLGDEAGRPWKGVLDFIDNQVDRGSGTLHARVTVPNPDLIIAPGEFARLMLPMSAPRPVLLVPDVGLVTDQSRKLVMTALPDGAVLPKPVEIGALENGGLRVVTNGLSPADQVIIDGLMRVRPGAKVARHPGAAAPAR